MSDSRSAILERIGRGLADTRSSSSRVAIGDRPAEVEARLSGAGRHTLPAVDADATAQLVRNMEAVQMTVVRLQSVSDVPRAVAFWLASEGVDGTVSVSPALAELNWAGVPELACRSGAATGDEVASVTPCLAAVAETGSVALASGDGTPATLNFLPENHAVVVRSRDIVRHMEDVFTRLRALETLPRALNLVTGPSRTADIEQTIEIGAHGPRRMHVLIVEGE